ncbi:uncharacterized protein LOC112589074 [Harpegnathos saltator]|uniref:uncharacterized protein LOC112589074 n=1 Tax=Harpegnathos saltator TaxID=610380 RepID=UPI000DBEE42E|nr:uncharacterized protein LOC112589074 [Harpegnathos saltator]
MEIPTPCVTIEKIEASDVTTNPESRQHKSRGILQPRAERIKKLLRLIHLNPKEQRTIEYICEEFRDIFHLEGESLTCTDRVEHEITTRIDTAPVNVRPYRLPEKHKLEVNRQIKEMHNDFRKLNNLTIGDSFPLPNITDILDQLVNSKYFTTLNLASGYHQIPMAEQDKAKTLTKLVRKGEKFIWTTAQQNALDTLKEKLTTAPVLKYPNFSQEFIVTTDASDHATEAILSQGPIGRDRPISYASRVLYRAEQNYNTTEKELLAIVWAVKHFRPYLYGTKFKIVTDHKPLTWLFNVTDPGSRLIRWKLKLEEYNYEIIHEPGKANLNADALSRNVAPPILKENIKVYNAH